MKRRDLDDRNIQWTLLREHDFEGHPDAMVNSALHALRFDSGFDEMLPDLHG
jgi:hypothetical protein